jgi:hypothetical protein
MEEYAETRLRRRRFRPFCLEPLEDRLLLSSLSFSSGSPGPSGDHLPSPSAILPAASGATLPAAAPSSPMEFRPNGSHPAATMPPSTPEPGPSDRSGGAFTYPAFPVPSAYPLGSQPPDRDDNDANRDYDKTPGPGGGLWEGSLSLPIGGAASPNETDPCVHRTDEAMLVPGPHPSSVAVAVAVLWTGPIPTAIPVAPPPASPSPTFLPAGDIRVGADEPNATGEASPKTTGVAASSPATAHPVLENEEGPPPAPEAGHPLAGVLPIDVEALQRSADAFFAQLADLAQEWHGSPVSARLGTWMMAASVVAYAWICRGPRKSSDAPVAEEVWPPGVAVLLKGETS